MISGLPNLEFVVETLGIEFALVQRPDYLTDVKTVSEPDYSETAKQLLIATEAPAILYWVIDRDPESPSREENTSEFTPMVGLLVAGLVKGERVQRQQRFLDVDIDHVLTGNPGRNRPGYTGANTWAGLLTRRRQGTRTLYDIPQPGVGIIWARYDIDYRSPFPGG